MTIVDDSPDLIDPTAYAVNVRDLAYQVWAYEAGRNVVQTMRILGTNYQEDVKRTTLQYWKAADEWETKRLTQLRAIAPDLEFVTKLELKLGAHDGALLLRRIVQGDATILELFGRQLDAAVKAARGLIEYGGFHAKGNDRLNLGVDAEIEEIDMSDWSVERLQQWEQDQL